jgi:hypothetical protein
MKLYVLDEPVPAEQQSSLAQAPRRSRLVGVGSAVALLLIAGGLGIAGVRIFGPGSSSGNVPDDDRAVIATAPGLTSLPATIAAQPPTFAPQGSRVINADSAPAQASSIVHKGGRYFVDLHDVDVGSALAMMSKATRTTVLGADVFRDHPARLTAQLTAASPQSAWQSVFGSVANFAVSCVGETCVVRIVSALGSGESRPPPPIAANVTENPDGPPENIQSEASMAAAIAAMQRQQQTTYTEDY